jgi:pimeloyl-ACP methyl ester carboxylesterase
VNGTGDPIAGARSRTVETSAGAVAIVEAGEGPSLLLLHREDAGPAYWRDYVPTFAQSFHVLVPDLGRLPPATHPAIAVGALLDALETERVAVVGHGSGGAVALELAATRPETGALLLLDATVGDAGAHVASLADRADVHVFLVWGEDDATSPLSVAEGLADALPMSALATIPGSGHDLPAEEPETLVPLLFEWLRFRYLGRSHRHDHEGPVLVTLGRRPTAAEEGLDALWDDDDEGAP